MSFDRKSQLPCVMKGQLRQRLALIVDIDIVMKAMGVTERGVQLLFRGALASLLLLYALDIKTNPAKWEATIASNALPVAQWLGCSTEALPALADWQPLYCQWLVLVSLLVVSGLSSGRALSWLAVGLNAWVCREEGDWLFAGSCGLI
jgi:hypothetical protein